MIDAAFFQTKAWRWLMWAACFIALMGQFTADSADPRITRIERYSTNKVLIHFDTEANRTYVLQYMDSLSCGTNQANCNSGGLATNWSNMYTGFAFPFTNHYIIPDTRTNKSRFYRLRVTP